MQVAGEKTEPQCRRYRGRAQHQDSGLACTDHHCPLEIEQQHRAILHLMLATECDAIVATDIGPHAQSGPIHVLRRDVYVFDEPVMPKPVKVLRERRIGFVSDDRLDHGPLDVRGCHVTEPHCSP